MNSFKITIIAAIAALTLSACSLGQPSGPLTIKGIHLGMSAAELDEAGRTNGWAVTDLEHFAPGRVGGSIKNGGAYYGRVTLDDQGGLISYELNTHAFKADDLSFQDFVESLQANYPIGELQPTHDWGDCARWEGRGPAGEVVATTNCGLWNISVTIGADQSGAKFD